MKKVIADACIQGDRMILLMIKTKWVQQATSLSIPIGSSNLNHNRTSRRAGIKQRTSHLNHHEDGRWMNAIAVHFDSMHIQLWRTINYHS